jgi:hypothetical protein
MPITAEDRAARDAESYQPDMHLTTCLRYVGAEIIAEASMLRGRRTAGAEINEYVMRDLRAAVSEAASAMAAYDAAIAAGKANVTNGEWRELKKAARPM